MKMKRKINYELAQEQWFNLTKIFDYLGVEIQLKSPENDLVDMTFAANSALIYKNKAIISKFTAIPRIPETNIYKYYFEKKGFETFKMDKYFEGAGDGLFSHENKNLWLGHGFRSVKSSSNEIKDYLDDKNLNIHSLELISPKWYHLDTCFCPIKDDYVILYDKAFDKKSLYKIYDIFGEDKCIKTSYEDALNFACNSVCVPSSKNISTRATIVGNSFSGNLIQELSLLNFSVIENSMSEFLLSGGSTKCLVLDLQDKNITPS